MVHVEIGVDRLSHTSDGVSSNGVVFHNLSFSPLLDQNILWFCGYSK